MVVRAHHEDAVLDRDGDDQRPDDEGQQTQGILGGRMAADRADDGLVGVERAGAEIAVDDAERRKRAGGGQGAVGRRSLGRFDHRFAVHCAVSGCWGDGIHEAAGALASDGDEDGTAGRGFGSRGRMGDY